MSIAMLSKLNAKTAKLAPSYGRGAVSWEDVAGALAGLPSACTWYAYALLETSSNDAPSRNKYSQLLTDYLASLLWSEMLKKGFKPRNMSIGQLSIGVAKAAMHCEFKSAGHCRRCDGKKWVVVDGKQAACKACGGSGVGEFSYNDKIAVGFTHVQDVPTKHCYAMSYDVYDQFAAGVLADIRELIDDKLNF